MLGLVLAAATLWAGPALGKDLQKIAVLIIGSGEGVPKQLTDDLTEIFIATIASQGGYKVMGKEAFETELGASADEKTGACVESPVCVTKVGLKLGLEFVLIGILGKTGATHNLVFLRVPMTKDERMRRYTHTIEGGVPEIIAAIKNEAPTLLKSEEKKSLLRVITSEKGATVWVDGVRKGTTPLQDLKLIPGPHKVKAAKEGFEDVEAGVTCPAHETTVIQLSLVRKPETMPTAATKPTKRGGTTVMRFLAWSTLGTTVVFGGLGTYYSIRTKQLNDELDDSCGSGTCDMSYSDVQSKSDSGKTSALVANVMWGLTGASALACVLLFVLDPGPEEEKNVLITPMAFPNGSGFATTIRF